MRPPKLDSFTRSYIRTMLWSTNDNSRDDGGDPLDSNYDESDLASETLALIVKDCAEFQRLCDEYIEIGCKRCDDSSDSEMAGHDFWLNRCGHGAGFWDGDWPEPQAALLDMAAEAFGNQDPYVGDDGLIYLV